MGFFKPDTRAEAIESSDKKRRILELRLAGATLESIGQSIGCSRQYVHGVIKDELAARAAETRDIAEHYRVLQSERLDKLILSHWTKATTGKDRQTAELVARLIDQQSKLFGAYAPVKAELTGRDGGPLAVRVNDAELDNAIRNLPPEQLEHLAALVGAGTPGTGEGQDQG